MYVLKAVSVQVAVLRLLGHSALLGIDINFSEENAASIFRTDLIDGPALSSEMLLSTQMATSERSNKLSYTTKFKKLGHATSITFVADGISKLYWTCILPGER
jgi:hypothetical protein